MKKTILIKAPVGIDCDIQEWEARYQVNGHEGVKLIKIESRSAMEVVVSKVSLDTFIGPETSYYISSPDFGVAIPPIPTLFETFWIMEKLIHAGMPAPDAVTIAQVLRDMEDF